MATVLPTFSSSSGAGSGAAPGQTWLSLCRRVRKECDLAGSDTAPASVLNQVGEMLLVVNWVNSAWIQIQSLRKWDWMWEDNDITIPADQNLGANEISADRYVLDATWNGDQQLTFMPWNQFRQAYPASRIVAGDPTVWSIRPDRAFVVNAKPATTLTLTVERYLNPTAMGTDNESPNMPPHMHEAIIWLAVMLYGGFDEAGGVYQHAKAQYKQVMGTNALDGLPVFEMGDPLC